MLEIEELRIHAEENLTLLEVLVMVERKGFGVISVYIIHGHALFPQGLFLEPHNGDRLACLKDSQQ